MISGKTVTVRNTASSTVKVPLTLPTAARKDLGLGLTTTFGSAYAGQRSAWNSVGRYGSARFLLAADSGFAASVVWPVAPDAPAGTPDPAIQKGRTTTVVPLPEAESTVLPSDVAAAG